MELSDKTARQLYEDVKANPARAKFGFGDKAALINIDIQKAYTRTDLFKTAYETDPNQLQYVNEVATLVRARGWPVIWTYVAYVDSGEDCGVWGTRTDTPDSLQNIKYGSERSDLDDRLDIKDSDIIMDKKMPSPFFETNLQSLLVFHQIDTLLLTGGSHPAACGQWALTACRAVTALLLSKNVSPTNMKVITLPISLT